MSAAFFIFYRQFNFLDFSPSKKYKIEIANIKERISIAPFAIYVYSTLFWIATLLKFGMCNGFSKFNR